MLADIDRLLDETGVIDALSCAELDRTRITSTAFPGARCVCCDTNVAVASICCFGMLTLCGECFVHRLKSSVPSFACESCGRDYAGLCKPGPFTEAVANLRQRVAFESAVDRAYCPKCRAPCTMDPEEPVGPHATLACEECRHVFCAFCKDAVTAPCRTGDGATGMGCGPNCRLEAMLTFELVPFRFATDDAVGSMIPNRRLCPKCFALGAYDGKCKFHECAECRTEYCFLCLQVKAKCPTSYGRMCVSEPVQQTLGSLPRALNVDDRTVARKEGAQPHLQRIGSGGWIGHDVDDISGLFAFRRRRRPNRHTQPWPMYGGDALGDSEDPPSLGAIDRVGRHQPSPPGLVSRVKAAWRNAAWRRTFPKSHGHCLAPMFTNTQIANCTYRRL